MSNNINAKELPLEKVFSDDYEYRIPFYQRPYSWTIEQASELFDDLYAFINEEGNHENNTSERDSYYFLGSIVLHRNEKKKKLYVIDGQQRLATLTILIASVRIFLKKYLLDGE